MKRYVCAETGRGFRDVGGGVEVESMHMMRSSGMIPLKKRAREEPKYNSLPPTPKKKEKRRAKKKHLRSKGKG